MLHQPFGLQMKLSHHIYELRSEFEEDSTYFTFNNLPSHFIYNVNNDLVAALGGKHKCQSEGRGERSGALWEQRRRCPDTRLPASAASLLVLIKEPCEHGDLCLVIAFHSALSKPGPRVND